ncbi:hypothetical protein V6N12_044401 [Hibiscus sabdariffa]|uniref:Pentatricopeptide repeat-containing protein n=1 Tax=Hibiscus sabdariffa TaxID=183260 RepID=A0ABR2AP13_9ROSI
MKLKEKSLNSGSFSPDLCTYNSLIHVLCSVGKDGVRASCWTYNILIDGLFRNGRAEAAYTMFCDLKKKGQFVDGVTYSIVVLQLCKDRLEEALRLVEEMEARGFLVDLVTITSLLVEFYKQGRWDWTERLMKHIRDGHLVPNVLKWKANMETLMKKTPKNRKDYTPLFPSRGDFSEMRSYAGQATGSNDDFEYCDEKGQEMSFIETDQWSSSPYMDQLANQVKSTEHASRLFSLIRGAKSSRKGDWFF